METKISGLDTNSILNQLKFEDHEIKETSREEKLYDISFSRVCPSHKSEKEWVSLTSITSFFKIPEKFNEISNSILDDERFDGHVLGTDEDMLLDQRGIFLVADVIKPFTNMDRKSYEALLKWSKKVYDDKNDLLPVKTRKKSNVSKTTKDDNIVEARNIIVQINGDNVRQFETDIGMVTPLIDVAKSIGLDRAMALKVINRNKLEFEECSIELLTESIDNKRPFGNPRLLCINKYGFIKFINHIQASRMKDVDSQSMVLKLKDIGAKIYGDLITGEIVVTNNTSVSALQQPVTQLPGVDHEAAFKLQFNIARELVSTGLVSLKDAYKTALQKASRLETVSVDEWLELIDGYGNLPEKHTSVYRNMSKGVQKKSTSHMTTRNLAQELNVIPRRAIKAALQEMNLVKLNDKYNICEVTPLGKTYTDRIYTTDNKRVVVWWKNSVLDLYNQNFLIENDAYKMITSGAK